MFRAAITILAKDLRLRLRDRSLLLFAVVVPLGLTVLFSFILPDEGEIELTGAVVDEDGGDVATGFAEGLLPALEDDGLLTLVEVTDAGAARDLTRSGDLDVAWIVPDGFSEDVVAGEGAELEVLVAAGRTIEGEVARGVADAFASQLGRISLAVAVDATAAGQAPTQERIEAVAAAADGHTPVIDVEELITAGEEQLDMVSYLAAGMASFFVFFVVSTGVVGLLEERQQGTMPRLLAAPIPPTAIQLGKALGALVIGSASMTVLTGTGALVLGARWGPPLGVAVLIVALVLAAMGVMALVGSVARTAEQASNFQSVVAVVLGLLGGVFFPLPAEGGLLRLATSASPHGWFIRGLSELSASGEWTVVLPAAGAMLAFAVVAAVPAIWLQRRMPA